MEGRHPPEHSSGHPKTSRNSKIATGARTHPVLRTLLKVSGLLFLLLVAALIACGLYVKKLIPQTPSIEDLLNAQIAEPSLLFSADGKQLAIYSQGHQERVRLSEVSPYVLKALIATEDHRFYEHRGIDVSRTLSAVWHTALGDPQGGSTITQQLARNLFPEEIGRSRTIERKLKEIITAIKIERAYLKEEILETYLNTVPFLYNVIGIEMAARTYYDKSAAELNVMESATLIGMLKGTSYYNPILNPARALQRRNVVLAQMVKHGELAAADFEAMRDQPLQVQLNRQPDPLGTAPHFAAHLRKWLIDWCEQNDYNLYTDGLIIHSTIDDRLQEAAQQAVERQAEVLQNIADVEWAQARPRLLSQSPSSYASLRKKVEPFKQFWQERPELLDAFVRDTPEFRKAVAAGQREAAVLAKLKASSKFMNRLRAYKTRLEAGFVAIDPLTGEVKAWVGSRDFARDQFDHVAQAERQPGSTFKPFVYGAALEMGMPPDRLYADGPVEIRYADGSVWRPTDMSGASGRMMSLREGLIYSKNTITAQVMQDVGLPNIVTLARAVGIKQSRLDPVPSLSLGTSPVTLLEMVSGYATIASAGEYRAPVMIKRITDRSGRVLAEFGSESEHVMSEQTAVELIDMMRGVVSRGTGTAVKNQFNITADIAGKTGTTQNNTDGWFILMHPNLVAGAWVGFNDSRVTMRSDHWGQGGHNAVLLVGDFFKAALKAKLIDAKARFPKPERPPPLLVETTEGWPAQFGTNAPVPLEGPLQFGGDPPAGYGVITGSDGRSVVIGSQAAASPPDNTIRVTPLPDSSRMLIGMGREPPGPARAESSGDSGLAGNSAASEEEEPAGRGRVVTAADVNLW